MCSVRYNNPTQSPVRMKMIQFGILLGIFPFCLGFPTLNARQEALSRALDASLDQLNSQSWGRNLLKLSHTGVTKIKPLQQMRYQRDDEVFEVNLKFSVRETTCDKDTTIDPTKCEFSAEPYMETPCESQVMVSRKKALVVKARCNLYTTSSSESHSSEEKFLTIPRSPHGRIRSNPERFPAQWDPFGKKNQMINPRWEEEDRTSDHFLLE
ncbi:secreted phosphoprotein 24 [Rana temporaria]|uniref:secreted phosphoprotein 24 n=1 Tax=Rana temporaria TaxID=8407 RepID=UPI001AAC68FC|nr:secreted phosphoprotein 24 [Rana temporaria]